MTDTPTEATFFNEYLPAEHQPFAKPMGDLYKDALTELAKPFPSTPLLKFPLLNQMTGGFRPHEFTILCGSTGAGKTTLCSNISADLIDQHVPHFVASVETGHTDYLKRIMSAHVREDWNTGEAIPVERLQRFHVQHGGKMTGDKMWLSLYDNRFSVETLMADLAWMVKHHSIKIAIIDNLNFFLEVTEDSRAVMEMDRVIHNLIIFCKRIPIHVLMVMHPKKTIEGRVESEFDVKGSSTAVQEAHNIFLFNRADPALIEKGTAGPTDRELMIAKMRRKGKYVRRKLLLTTNDGVSYQEGQLL